MPYADYEKQAEWNRRDQARNPERWAAYIAKGREVAKAKRLAYRQAHPLPPKLTEVERKERQRERDRIRRADPAFREKERERNLRRMRSPHRQAYWRGYIKDKRANDIQYRLSDALRARLRDAMKGRSKDTRGSAVGLLGCTIQQAVAYIEAMFQPGMTWDNHGLHGWHIDHIQPLASFDLTKIDQLTVACHYTNLQPLWAYDNRVKGARRVNG